MKMLFKLVVLLGGLTAISALAQVPPPTYDYQPLSAQQLDQLLGPIALYPDPLIAQILPAATLPTQIVLANRYLVGGGDPAQIDQQSWDGSVKAVAHYPNVLQWLDVNLTWTTVLGQAFLNQQQEVMDSIQRLRTSAQGFGNLQSTPQQQVVAEDGLIEILPADPSEIYVPVYAPEVVYFQGGRTVSFGAGLVLGGWLNCDFDWHHHQLLEWDRDHPRPVNWWRERLNRRDEWIGRQATVWRPDNHSDRNLFTRGDRGWGASWRGQTQPRETSRDVTRGNFSPPPARSGQPVSNGALIGVESSHDTRAFSNRGQQSLQPASRPAPVSHSGPAGGGGGHGGGSASKH